MRTDTTICETGTTPARTGRKAGAKGTDTGVTVLRVAKLVTADAERLCLVRSISPRGLIATFEDRILPGERVAIELGGDRLEGLIASVATSTIEVRFDAPVEIATLMGTREAWQGGVRRSAPRVEVDCRGRLQVGSEVLFVGVRDISQDGMRIESDDILFPGDQVTATLHGFGRPIRGIVRWCRDGAAGIAFHEPVALKALTLWLAECGGARQDLRGIARQ